MFHQYRRRKENMDILKILKTVLPRAAMVEVTMRLTRCVQESFNVVVQVYLLPVAMLVRDRQPLAVQRRLGTDTESPGGLYNKTIKPRRCIFSWIQHSQQHQVLPSMYLYSRNALPACNILQTDGVLYNYPKPRVCTNQLYYDISYVL